MAMALGSALGLPEARWMRWIRRRSAKPGLPVSPHTAGLRAHHGLTGFARERLLKLWHVRDYAVDAVFQGRMRVGHRAHALALRTLVATRPLRHADEEPLLGREAFGRLQRLAPRGVFPGDICQQRAAQV